MLFPHRTMCRFHIGQCVASTQDNVWSPHRTMYVVHTGQCVVSTQDHVSCPNSTMCRVQTGHFDVAETNAPKRSRRNVHDETCTTKRPRRNVHDVEFSGRNIRAWPYARQPFSVGAPVRISTAASKSLRPSVCWPTVGQSCTRHAP